MRELSKSRLAFVCSIIVAVMAPIIWGIAWFQTDPATTGILAVAGWLALGAAAGLLRLSYLEAENERVADPPGWY